MRKVDEEVRMRMRADKGWAVEKSVVFRASVWRLAAETHTPPPPPPSSLPLFV
jgi:hypothetical protein